MKRKIYISDGIISLSEYIESEDDYDCYNCWKNEETQNGYNHKLTKTFEEWSERTTIKSRFIATVIRLSDNACIGAIFLSPEDTPPDLAFMIYPLYRNMGYGTRAFGLGVRCCFDVLNMDYIHAGCYPDNIASTKIIEKCGFKPNPDGNMDEKHYLTGEKRTQYDFIIHNKN